MYIGMKSKLLIILLLSVCLSSCCDDSKVPTVSAGMEIVRLDSVLSMCDEIDDCQCDSILNRYRTNIETWFGILGIDSVDCETLSRYASSQAMKVFVPDIMSRFVSSDSISAILAKLKESMANKLNGRRLNDVNFVVSQYRQSVFIKDSMMFVGVNHYLGEGYAGYGYFEPYQRKTKTPKHMPYDMIEAFLADAYPFKETTETTILERIIYNGSILYVLMDIMPNADLAEALGYTADQLNWIETNEKEAWRALIARNLLYSTSVIDADKLLKPSPATTILHPESPGRVGRYIGYKIVKSYVENNKDIELEDLLSPAYYGSMQTLIDAKYSAQ